MKRTSLALAGLVSAVLARGISAQDSTSAMEFFDASGAQTTAKIGWSGSAANGHVFIETPSDGEGVIVKQGVITAQGFVGDGSGLTDLPQQSVEVNDVDGLQSALDGKATATQVAAQIKDSLLRIDQALAGKPSVAQVAAQISDSLASQTSGTGGTISGITAGAGLAGGGVTGTVSISAAFSRSGSVDSIARADHSHTITSASIGAGEVKTINIENGAITDAKIAGMSWNKLSGIPAGFADGIDNGIIGVTAGTGIAVTASTTSPTVAVNLIASGGNNGTATSVARSDHWHTNLAGGSNRVGVNTSVPKAPLHVKDTRSLLTAASVDSGTLVLESISPTAGHAGMLVNSTGNGFVRFATNGTSVAEMVFEKNTKTIFFGPAGTGTQILTVDVDGGNVGVNTAAPSASYALDVNGNIQCVVLKETSDERYKKDITPITNALETVEAINGVRYKWRDVEFSHKDFSDKEQIGVIAQNVEEVLPELVTTDEEGYKSVSYNKLTAVLIEAVKEQQNTIRRLESRLELLENKIE